MQTFTISEYEALREQIANDPKEKCGCSCSCSECAEKSNCSSSDPWNVVNSELDRILAEFAERKRSGSAPDSGEAQALVKKLQDFFTTNYYACTTEILSGLGEMYVSDEGFKANIERHCEGTAEYMQAAIMAYCK